jgi:hypothetical protein
MGSNIKFNFKNIIFLFILCSFIILLATLARSNNYKGIKNKDYDAIITEKYIDKKKFSIDKGPSITGNKNGYIHIYI